LKLLDGKLRQFMLDDTHLRADGSPKITITVEGLTVGKREGVAGVALPKMEVWAKVTLSDSSDGAVLGVATVSGETGSRVVANPEQMASIIARGTAKWIYDNTKGKDMEETE
jgi:hypothetical protein